LTRLVVRYTMLTGNMKYREPILRWASDINENENKYDQILAGLFAAAHFFDGDERWLERAYQMALRYDALTRGNDCFHQCGQDNRQGSKYVVDPLYLPILGDPTFATRGEMPRPMFRYQTDGAEGLSEDVAIRVWYKKPGEYYFEAKNLGARDLSIQVRMYHGAAVNVAAIDKQINSGIYIQAGSVVKGIFQF